MVGKPTQTFILFHPEKKGVVKQNIALIARTFNKSLFT